MKTKLYLLPQIEVVQMHLDQAVLSGSPQIESSSNGSIDLTLNDFGDETAW